MAIKGAEKLPAPNQYDLDTRNTVLVKSPSFVFGSEKRSQDHKTVVPGPGTYPQKNVIGAGMTAKVMAGKLPE